MDEAEPSIVEEVVGAKEEEKEEEEENTSKRPRSDYVFSNDDLEQKIESLSMVCTLILTIKP